MTRFDLSPLFRTTVGFDRLFQLFDEMAETPTSAYPPYNIEKINENNYRISMAVAGFRPEDIEVELKQNRLTIQGKITAAKIAANPRGSIHAGRIHAGAKRAAKQRVELPPSRNRRKSLLKTVQPRRTRPSRKGGARTRTAPYRTPSRYPRRSKTQTNPRSNQKQQLETPSAQKR